MENMEIENSTQDTQEMPIHKKRGIIRKIAKKIYDFFSKPIPLMLLAAEFNMSRIITMTTCGSRNFATQNC
jgi:hypothetical protein